MKAQSSFKYFQLMLTNVLNYFSHENLNEFNNENSSVKPIVKFIDKSYKLIIERFPNQIRQYKNLKQTHIIEYYKQTFDNIDNPLPKPILQLNQNNDQNKFEQQSQHDLQILDNTINNDDNDEQIEENEIVIEQKLDKEEIVLW